MNGGTPMSNQLLGKTQVYEIVYQIPVLGLCERAYATLHEGEITGSDTVGSQWSGTYSESGDQLTMILRVETKPGVANAVTGNGFPQLMEEPLRLVVRRAPNGYPLPAEYHTDHGTLYAMFRLLNVY